MKRLTLGATARPDTGYLASRGSHRKPVLEAGHHHRAFSVDETNDGPIEGVVASAQRLPDVAVDVAQDRWAGVGQFRPSLLIGGSRLETTDRAHSGVEGTGHAAVIRDSLGGAPLCRPQGEADDIAARHAADDKERDQFERPQRLRPHEAPHRITIATAV